MAFLRSWKHGSWTLALGTGTAILVSGCSGPAPNYDPTYSCTPEAGGGTPYPCAKIQKDVQIERDRLYAEAEVVLRKRWAEYERIYRAGGVDEATPVMRETMTGEALTDALKDYQQVKTEKLRAVGGHFQLSDIRRVPDAVVGTSVVTLQACLDMSSVTMRSPRESSPGAIALQRVYFSDVNGRLMASYLEGKKADKCN